VKLHRRNYQAWTIHEEDFPKQGGISEQISFLAGYGQLAPSVHNTQPWNFEISGATLTITPDRSRNLPVADARDHGLWIAIGACTENIVQAASHFDIKTTVRVASGVVTITFKKSVGEPDSGLLSAIPQRHSNKLPYTGTAIKGVLSHIASKANLYDTKLKLVARDGLKQIIDIHLPAAEAAAGNPNFVRELVRWMRVNNTGSYDGMPGFVIGNSPVKSMVGKMLFKAKPAVFKKAAAADRQLLASSSAVAIFCIKEDTELAWINCGRAAENFWLHITKKELVAQPLTAIMNNEDANAKLVKKFKLGGTPAFLMRIGYETVSGLPTPRKNL
jgi:hypothetical protein